jgi:hypothetical protein
MRPLRRKVLRGFELCARFFGNAFGSGRRLAGFWQKPLKGLGVAVILNNLEPPPFALLSM